MHRAISSFDHDALVKLWKGLEDTFFTSLDKPLSDRFLSLRAYTFKTLLCEAAKSSRTAAIQSFFSNQTLFDLITPEWTSWLGNRLVYFLIYIALPFVKDPQKNELFGRYFTKTWTDVLRLSLTNFLCVLFSSLPNYSSKADNLERSSVMFFNNYLSF